MSDTYSNCLFSGYTPIVKTPRDLAIERLDRVADLMTDEEFSTWLEDIASTAADVNDLRMAAEDWLNGDDCNHCNDAMCKCTYHNQEIPF